MSSSSSTNNNNTNGTVTLDTEKHLGRNPRRSRVPRLDQSNGTASVSGAGSEEFTVSTGNDDDDEFGGASDSEGPDSMFLTSLETEYEREGQIPSSVLKPTKSQLQAHLPMGLDKEKHEDIGGLLLNNSSKSGAAATSTPFRKLKDESVSSHNSCDEFGDADDHDLPAPQRLTESDHDLPPPQPSRPSVQEQRRIGASSSGLDSEKHEEIGDLFDSRHEGFLESTHDARGEFGDAQENDAPVNQYLQNATQSMWMEDRGVVPRRVTPSQLQAYIPSGLDSEKHEEIGDLMDSRHDHDDLDEFGDADEHDVPHKRFLYDSSHSRSYDDFETSSHGHVQRTTTGRAISAPVVTGNNKRDQRPKDTDIMSEGDEQQDQYNDSYHDYNDDMESEVEYEDLKGSDTLDTEKHEDLGDLKEVVSDDEDEFEMAGENDDPVPRYLQSQHSLHGDDLLAFKGNGRVVHGLDHENHEDISGFRSGNRSATMSDDEDEFECAGSYDNPSSMFLKHQLSMQHNDFFSSTDSMHSQQHMDDKGMAGSTS